MSTSVIPHKYATLPINAMSPHPRNANVGNVDAIQKSIRENGYYPRVIVQEKTGHILVGNHTWEAARAEGFTELQVMIVDIDDKKALKIMLSDNRTAELAHRDEEILASLLSELQLTDDLTGTGYIDADLDALIAGMTVPDFQPSEEPPPRLDEKKKVICPACDHEFTP